MLGGTALCHDGGFRWRGPKHNTAYADGTDLEQYVQFINSGTVDSDLQVDVSGGANSWVTIATITGVRSGLVGVDADDLETSGTLITI